MQFPQLLYQDSGAERPLQPWATSLFALGVNVVESRKPGQRLVFALALPIRAYAALLVTAGIVWRRSHEPVDQVDTEAHFEHLSSLPVGTRVIFSDRKRRHRAIITGTELIKDTLQTAVKIQLTEKDKLSHFIFKNQSGNVEILDWEGDLPETRSGTRIARRIGFLDAVLGENDPRAFVSKSRLDALVIGSASLLRNEIRESPLSIQLENQRYVPGSFQDLLRVRRYAPTQAYRSEVVSDTFMEINISNDPINTVVVFDGARSFLKHRDNFRNNSWVVLLDRTAAGFPDACDALNQEYMRMPRQKTARTINVGDFPWGVEFMAYEEPAS